MDRYTGKNISELEHVRNSIIDILSTPIGSRVENKEYGSGLFFLIDKPINKTLVTQIYSEVGQALLRWESRVLITNIGVSLDKIASDKSIIFDLEGVYLPNDNPIRLDGLNISFNKYGNS